MELAGLQIVFILIALAEQIFLKSPVVFRGILQGNWEMPRILEWAGAWAGIFLLAACFLGNRLIYRKPDLLKNGESKDRPVLRRWGIFWTIVFYGPYVLYSIAGDMVFLFLQNGRGEGIAFFLIKAVAFIWLGVFLYKMPAETP